ncbi:MAG: hypothetical protein HC927_12965 [Deltaproteobacteria bacterium]|nr:hypothetical protein [Deltaproteobacteria bacterium]
MSKSTIAIVAISLLSISSTADASTYPPFCGSMQSQCVYTGPDAPVLRLDVCWDGSVATLKGTSPCPLDSRPYYVDFGDVDAFGVVNAYIPLDWACDHTGICVAGPAPGSTSAEPICCDGGVCYPVTDAGCTGLKVLCQNGVSNDDGTVTCFEGTEL